MTQTTQAPQNQRSRKIRALAAGGAVLGLGVAITLAAWSDSEFADGLFTTQDFGIQAANSFDAPVWGDHVDKDTALELSFGDVGSDKMYPGQTITVPYQIRNVVDGAPTTVTYDAETKTGDDVGLNGALSSTIYQVATDAVDCSSLTGATELAQAGTFNLIDNTPQRLCVQVTLDEAYSSPTSAVTDYTWSFTAEHDTDSEAF